MTSDAPEHLPEQRLRIAILAPRDLSFAAWELNLFEKIARDSRYEIVALLIGDREPPDGRNLLQKLVTPKLFQRLLHRAIMAFDQRALNPEPHPEAPHFNALLPCLKQIRLHPERRHFVDYFSHETTKPVRELGLDVILRHAFGIIKGDILDAAAFGIWSFHHADNRVIRGSPPGFWETLHNHPVTGATLQILTPELDGGRVIARCWHTTEPNAIRNANIIYELSNTLILRELDRVARTRTIDTQNSETYDQLLFVAPGARDLLRYLAGRVRNVASGILHQIRRRARLRPRMWTLGIGNGNIEDAALWRTKLLDPPAGHFWADPFVIEQDGGTYIFFEEYAYSEDRAWISVGTLEGDNFTYIDRALDTGYHMSFPFVIADGDEVFMIPETSINKRIEVWRATKFPDQWELHTTALNGTDVADALLHRHEDQWWLFANITQTLKGDYCNELHIFQVDGPNLKQIKPHPENPVVIDSQTARSGGRPFYRDGRLFRPSQNNSYGIYGYGLNIMEVTELSATAYREQPYRQVKPDFHRDIVATHHVDQTDDSYIIDVCKAIGGRGRS